MGKIRFDLRIEDEEYENRLSYLLLASGAFTQSMEDGQERIVFVDQMNETFMEEDEDKSSSEESSSMSRTKMVILTSIPGPATYRDGRIEIYKYERFSIMLQMILKYFGHQEEHEEAHQKTSGVKRVSIVGCMGGVGVSSIATSMTSIMFKNGYKPLYIDLAPYNPERLALPEGDDHPGDNDMIRVLYSIKKNMLKDISPYVCSADDVDTIRIPPFNYFTHYMDEDVLGKIGGICGGSGYDLIIVDVGNHLDKKNLEITRHSDVIVMVLSMGIQWNDEKILELDYSMGIDSGKVIHVLNDSGRATFRQNHAEIVEGMEKVDVAIPFHGIRGETKEKVAFGDEIRFLSDLVGGRIAEE